MNKRFARLGQLKSTKGNSGRYPVSGATIWRWVKLGKFPAPIKLSENITVWDVDKLDAWDAAKAASGQQA